MILWLSWLTLFVICSLFQRLKSWSGCFVTVYTLMFLLLWDAALFYNNTSVLLGTITKCVLGRRKPESIDQFMIFLLQILSYTQIVELIIKNKKKEAFLQNHWTCNAFLYFLHQSSREYQLCARNTRFAPKDTFPLYFFSH